MSYILEALRRAEAQRQQQSAEPPGLGSANGVGMPTEPAPAAPSPAPTAAEPAPRRSGWLAGSVAVAVLGLAAVVVLQATRPATGPATASPAANEISAASSASATSATPAAAPRPAPTAVPASPPPTEAAPAPILQPAPAPAPVPVPEAARPAQPPTTARPTSAAVPRYADLPESVRSTLPAISVQGVTWSENPALRHLIVNGRVLQEGQSIGPEHVLEQIGRDGSVLNHRGQRYRIGH